MKNTQYGRLRDNASLLNQLNKLVRDYAKRAGTNYDCALRDVLTDARHLCDLNGLDYGHIDARAYSGYCEENGQKQTA